MPNYQKIEGVCPATFVLYTDETCRKIDEKAQRAHYRRLLEHELGALVIGGHAGEIVSLSSEDRAVLIRIAKEEAKGRIPIVGGVVADGTADAVRQTREQKEAGADAVMVTPPAVPGWKNEVEMMIRHMKAIEEVGLGIVLISSPNELFGPQYFLNADMMRALIQRVPSVVAVKITSEWNIGGFIRLRKAIKSVSDNVGCLEAGGQAHYAHYAYGAEGSLSGGTNFALGEDVEMYKHAKAGRFAEAKALSDSWLDVYDVVYGIEAGLPLVHFHYRYKIVAWLMGIIENPHMRLPQMPPPIEEIHMLREALQRAGKPMVRNSIKPLQFAAV